MFPLLTFPFLHWVRISIINLVGISSCIQHLLLGQITVAVVSQFIEKRSKVAVVQGKFSPKRPFVV